MNKIMVGTLIVISGIAAIAVAAGNWSAAQSKYRAFDREQSELRKLTPWETRKIVTAICQAEEEERKDTAADAGRRAKDKVMVEYSSLENLKDEATQSINDVIADSSLSSYHTRARGYRAEIIKRWDSIRKMTKSIRGANHPVISFMLDQGNKAHDEYQRKPGNCDVYEFTIGKGRADCLKAEEATCTVIELKPDNRRAISTGKSQAYRYARELNKKTDAFKNLVSKNRAFASCEHFDTRVDCYTLCPDIDEDGEFSDDTVTSWRPDCR